LKIEECKSRLLELLKDRALEIRKVILSSGKESDYYLDERVVTLLPEGAYLTAKIMLDILKDADVDAAGGPTVAADPIAGAIASVSHADGHPIAGFIVRKEPKEHGMGKQVEGPIQKGMKVAIVDGTMTTGGSLLKAIEVMEKEGCEVVKVLVIIDRLEGGREKIQEKGYDFAAIFTRHDLLGE
jgi:orotate phosphoribosyltransferase